MWIENVLKGNSASGTGGIPSNGCSIGGSSPNPMFYVLFINPAIYNSKDWVSIKKDLRVKSRGSARRSKGEVLPCIIWCSPVLPCIICDLSPPAAQISAVTATQQPNARPNSPHYTHYNTERKTQHKTQNYTEIC